jgi:hypothetical protein
MGVEKYEYWDQSGGPPPMEDYEDIEQACLLVAAVFKLSCRNVWVGMSWSILLCEMRDSESCESSQS